MKRVSLRRHFLRLLGLALGGLMLLAPQAALAEGWLPFKFASPPKVEAEDVQVGADGKGNVTAIWRNDPNITNVFGSLTIHSALLSAGAANFAPPAPVTTNTGVGSPRLGVAENGTAIAVWERNTGSKDIVEGATRALGTWGGVSELTDSGDETADYLSMALAKNGQGLVTWRTPNSPYRNKVRLINGGNFAAAPSTNFPSSPYTSNKEPDVAVSPDGGTRFLVGDKHFPSSPGQTNLNLFTLGGGGWSEGAELSKNALRPRVAAAANGEPVVAWMEANKVMVQRGKGEPVTVASPGGLSYLALAVGPNTEEFPNGMVVVAWLQFVDDSSHACCDQIRAAVGNGFTMGAPLELSDELEDVEGFPQAAVGPDGTGYVAWTRYDGSFWVPQASVRPPGGSFDLVADDLAPGDATVTDLTVAPDGHALVGFQQIDEEGGELYWRAAVSIYEPPPQPQIGTDEAKLISPPPSSGSGADATPPKVKLRLSRKGFAPGSKLNKVEVEKGERSYVWKQLRADLKVGTRVLVSLDEAASVAIRVDKLGCFTAKPGNPARGQSSKCDKPDPDVQRFRAQGKDGLNRYVYLGDWNGGKVKPGALYEFEVVATDKFGNTSRPQRIRFTLDGKPSANGF